MKLNPVSNADLPELSSGAAGTAPAGDGQRFDKALMAASLENPGPKLMSESRPIEQSQQPLCSAPPANSASIPTPESIAAPKLKGAKIAATYEQNMQNVVPLNRDAAGVAPDPSVSRPQPSDFEKYKDDQLLRNPGGRNYYIEEKKVVENSSDQQTFGGRLGKTISAVTGNIKNFAGNIFFGSKFLYRGQGDEIREGTTRGFMGAVRDFFKDMGGALSFGAFHPDRAEAPKGFTERLVYSAGKLKDAVLNDVVEGIPSSINQMGKNLVLAGWHLVQVMPDATIGNFDAGRKLTTSIFDNGHVAVEYLTDVMPTGDAWLRVHASNFRGLQPPVLYNLKMPEQFTGDTRWEYVRNTPFRKSIETIGSLLADAAFIYLLGQTGSSSNRHHQVE